MSVDENTASSSSDRNATSIGTWNRRSLSLCVTFGQSTRRYASFSVVAIAAVGKDLDADSSVRMSALV